MGDRGAWCVVRRSSVSGWLIILGLVCAVVGYFGPWVPHKTAALTVTGFELAEFAKFFPQVQGGTVSVVRALFYTPLVTAAVLLALRTGRSIIRPVRLVGPPVTAVILLVVLLPYPVVDTVRQALATRSPVRLDPQHTGQLRLVAVGVALALLALPGRRLSRRVWGGLVALLALGGAVPSLWQFAILRPLVVALYDKPFDLGWGLVACVAGFALLLISGVLVSASPRS
mgnify:CR=1 FL=1